MSRHRLGFLGALAALFGVGSDSPEGAVKLGSKIFARMAAARSGRIPRGTAAARRKRQHEAISGQPQGLGSQAVLREQREAFRRSQVAP